MALNENHVELDERQQYIFDEMCLAIDGAEDGTRIMSSTLDLVRLLLKRAEDSTLREDALADVSRFCLGLIRPSEPSQDDRNQRLREFAKASLKILIAKRTQTTLAARSATPPPALRRASDRLKNPG